MRLNTIYNTRMMQCTIIISLYIYKTPAWKQHKSSEITHAFSKDSVMTYIIYCNAWLGIAWQILYMRFCLSDFTEEDFCRDSKILINGLKCDQFIAKYTQEICNYDPNVKNFCCASCKKSSEYFQDLSPFQYIIRLCALYATLCISRSAFHIVKHYR